jgi:ubiquinone/menaquinone biosynthesis C-methylase UbiE
MKVGWKVDFDASHVCFVEIKEKIMELRSLNVKNLLDIGGGTGWYTTRLKKISPKTRMIIMDVEFRGAFNPELEYVRGNMLSLPFRDGAFDAVTAMASLHHVSDELETALDDLSRVMSEGGTLLTAEPCANNPPANLAKRIILTTIHDEREAPLDPESFEKQVEDKFKVIEVGYYFYLSYLIPHIVGRLPSSLKSAGRQITKSLYRLDKELLSSLPGLRKQAAYIYLKATKKSRANPAVKEKITATQQEA